ncbi:hypothetical protein MKW98_027009 [Papaver atlanticum]|uniref:RNA helicase n=1 Tax=Papaver atlanticum TaxID=357466 RepID=A0AAD4RXZ7_9MAGN|nr:hypothetical protein MKW98_027009 [Papaver atlanticum]
MANEENTVSANTIFHEKILETITQEELNLEEQGINIEALTIDETKKAKCLVEPEDSNIKKVTGDTIYQTAKRFEDLNLSRELLMGLYVEMNFKTPSKIQSVSLPMILSPPYKDLVAQAHNGSGKTACFVLGMLSRIDINLKAPQAICICPTRELAIQNLEVLTRMGKHTKITSISAVPTGKTGLRSDRAPICDQIVVGTPGTIKKWMSQNRFNARDIKMLVFDEADHMLAEDGFKDDSERIMNTLRKSSAHCLVLLFSATFNDTVKNFVSKMIKDGNQMFVKKEELSLESVKQFKVNCPDEAAKRQLIDKVLELGDRLGQIIIFVRTKKSAKTLHEALDSEGGWKCTNIHGDFDTDKRDEIVKEFKDGLTKVLIATDILARGFDQSQVNLVINYDLPTQYDCLKHNPSEPHYEVYLHRCGRAGRFGRKEAVLNLLCTDPATGTDSMMLMEKIERHFGVHVSQIPDHLSEEDLSAVLKEAGLL